MKTKITRLLLIISTIITLNSFCCFPAIAITEEQQKLNNAITQQANIEKTKPGEIAAGESFLYNTYLKVLISTKRYSIKISNMLSTYLIPLIWLLIISYLGFLYLKEVATGMNFNTLLSKNLAYFFFMVLILVVLNNYTYYTQLIFNFFSFLVGKILELSIQDTTILEEFQSSPLKNSFLVTESLSGGIDHITEVYIKQNSNGLMDFSVALQGFLLKIVYWAIAIAYMTVFTLASVTMTLFFALGKPLILISLFPPFRKYAISWIEAIVSFGFQMIIVALAMGLTIFTVTDTFVEFNTLVEAKEKLPETAYFELLLVGCLSLFYHISVSTISAMLTKAHVQDFGRTFTALVSLGGATSRTAWLKGGKQTAIAGAKGLAGGVKGFAGGSSLEGFKGGLKGGVKGFAGGVKTSIIKK
jgi:type IV secretory pathway VirB6-like protein